MPFPDSPGPRADTPGTGTPTSPPKGLSSSPSIFAYQTRLLDSSSRTNSGTGLNKQLLHRSSPSSASASTLSSASSSSSSAAAASGSGSGTGANGLSHSPALSSLANMLGETEPSTPIRRNVARMAAGFEEGAAVLQRTGSSKVEPTSATPVRNGRGHVPSKSVDAVRGKWEQKIQKAEMTDDTPKASKRYTFMSPPSQPSSTNTKSTPATPAAPSTSSFSSVGDTPASRPGKGSEQNTSTGTPSHSRTPGSRNMSVDSTHAPSESDAAVPPSPALSFTSSSSRVRPASVASVASVASYTSVLSPDTTGSSSVASNRSQTMEDTLAQARANALKRREARKKADGVGANKPEAGVASTPGGTFKQAPTGKDEAKVPTLKAAPAPVDIPTAKTPVVESKGTGRSEAPKSSKGRMDPPATPVRRPTEEKKSSPFAHLFTPPSEDTSNSSSSTTADQDSTPKSRSYKSITTPTSVPVTARYNPPGLSSGVPPSAYPSGLGVGGGAGGGGAGKDKYGSISMSDRRRLGRHLPRIASGGEGWEGPPGADEEKSGSSREGTARRIPSNLASSSTATGETETVGAKRVEKKKSVDILTPSSSFNQASSTVSVPPSPVVPSTPSKRRSAYLGHLSKASIDTTTPAKEWKGDDMKGLIKAVGATPGRGGAGVKEEEGVTGLANRFRLSKAALPPPRLPPSASSAQVAPAPLPSRRLMQTNWMDRQRHALHAYEYLCHVGEALQWIEGALDEEVGFGVVEMEQGQGLQDGVVLAKLARRFLGEGAVKSIWTDTKHRYKQTDNINHFLKLVRSVGMPETFVFELTDLYNKRDIPKVIFCIHVLSHILARLGQAERIGNLVGQFEFTDEQLAATQKGLQGVSMPNFGDAKANLAKEASWEPEEPEETEDEKRDRELLECQDSICALQRHLRGRLARQRLSRVHAKLDLAETSITALQARARGQIARKEIQVQRDERKGVESAIVGIQAAARSRAVRKRFLVQVETVYRAAQHVVAIQAHARGMLVRKRMATDLIELEKAKKSIVALQAMARGRLVKKVHTTRRQQLSQPATVQAITLLQAVLRGELHRQAEARQIDVLFSEEEKYVRLQAHLRGALVRRSRQAHEQKMDDASSIIIAIQSVCRGLLVRRKKQALIKAVVSAMPTTTISGLQAFARARLAQQNHQTMRKALAKVEVATSVGGLQAFLRSKLAKKQTQEQKKKLEFVSPDVIGFQAQARGVLARRDYNDWREYLHDPHTQGALVFLQSLIRGFNARRRFWIRTSDYRINEHKIVKIQALWRGRWERKMYDRLMTGADVDVPTVQNYMHLLIDTERDFTDQIHTETLRREVFALVRENQGLETEVQELETKIALIVKNKMSFEELAKAKRRAGHGVGHGHGQYGADEFSVNGQGDPFSGTYLDKAGQRKLDLYEQLFFTLQTKPEYLSRLIRTLHLEEEGKETRLVQGVVLSLFGYGHERREQYLFHKLLQLSVHTEALRSQSLENLAGSRFPLHNIVSTYLKATLAPYLQLTMTRCIADVVNAGINLDLSTDPFEIYTRLINDEETITGLTSQRPRDRDADQVLQTDADARALYIRHLQELRHLTDILLKSLYNTFLEMPYTIRYMVREAFLSLRIKYDAADDQDLSPIVAKAFLLPFLLPGLIAPETWGITDPARPLGPNERRNLAAIANLVGIIAMPDADPASMKPLDRFVRVPLQEYVAKESVNFRAWMLDLAAVEPLESFFETHELFESTMEAKPIMITRTEIYGMLSVLIKHSAVITANQASDPVGLILTELEGPPVDYDRGKTAVSLRLTNRLAELAPGDPDALIKEDFVQAKRHVLAVLRIQNGRTLYDILVARPEEIDEQRWVHEVYRDIELENARAAKVGLPPTPVEAGYQIESIRSLPFHEVKSRAIEFCMKLERAGKITRRNAYQDLLISIAGDIRSKHHLRKMLRQGLAAMTRAHEDSLAKKKGFEESIQSYHTFIDSSMANLQKGKKKPVFLSKQYRHQWSQDRQGKKAQFGSYKYTAHDLYEKGILLGINQCSPRQFDKIHVVMASNEVGVFSLEMTAPQNAAVAGASTSATGSNGAALMGREEVRMEDLLQAQFDNELNLLLFDGMATFSINMLIHQINKKFYST